MAYLDFKAIKAQVTILQVLDRYQLTRTLKRSGESLTGKCPIHQGDRGDSFRVSLDRQCFHCFSCQAHGNQLDLVAALENCSPKEAALKLTEWFRLDTGERSSPPPRRREDPRASAPTQRPAGPATAVASASSTGSVRPPATEPKSPPIREANKPLGFSLAEKLDPDHPYLRGRGLDEAAIREFGVGFCHAGTMIGRVAIPLHNAKGELVG